jgi:putative membrane protein
MVKEHEEDVAEFSKEVSGGQNPAIKDFATQTLPTLQDHLKEAREMRQNVAPVNPATSKSTSGGGSGRK